MDSEKDEVLIKINMILASKKSYYRVTNGNHEEKWLGSFFEALRLFKQWGKEYGVASLFKEIMLDYKRYVDHFKTVLLYQAKPERR